MTFNNKLKRIADEFNESNREKWLEEDLKWRIPYLLKQCEQEAIKGKYQYCSDIDANYQYHKKPREILIKRLKDEGLTVRYQDAKLDEDDYYDDPKIIIEWINISRK